MPGGYRYEQCKRMETGSWGLARRRRFKKRYRPEVPDVPLQPIRANQAWSADFMSDALYDGRAFRTFNVIDDYNREALRIEVDVSLTAERVIRVLDQLITIRGRPERLRAVAARSANTLPARRQRSALYVQGSGADYSRRIAVNNHGLGLPWRRSSQND